MVKKAVNGGFLKATTKPEPADAFLIAVPTPFLPVKEQNSIPEPDLSYIKSAAKAVAKVLKKGDLVILESTSPVGAVITGVLIFVLGAGPGPGDCSTVLHWTS